MTHGQVTIETGLADALKAMQIAMAHDDLQAASEAAVRAHDIDPECPSPVVVLGQAALAGARPQEARDWFVRAVARAPNFLTHGLLASSLHALDRHGEARAHLAQAIATAPDLPESQFFLGGICGLMRDVENALALYERCLATCPDHARAWHQAGLCRLTMGDAAGAVADMRRGMALAVPGAAQWTDLSAALSACGDFEAAREAAERAVSMSPGDVKALNNLGHALVQLNRSRDAVPVYAQAAALACDMPEVRFGQAIALLKAGEFDRGWAEYEWRWRDCQRPRTDLTAPLWLGEPIEGRTILVHAEQGFGDSLQFVRFVPLLAERGARVILHVPAALERLMRNIAGVTEVVTRVDPALTYDAHCPMATLPFRFGARPGRIPNAPYLCVPEAEQARQGNALRARASQNRSPPDLVVGLVWSGDPRPGDPKSNLVDRRRSIALRDFSPLFSVSGVRFVSFQFGAKRETLDASGVPILDAMEGVADFADTAARLCGIDLLISVDTSIVHLAGGMGYPVWMLSRFDACWRWQEARSDTPWYPSMHIIRQPDAGDWEAAIQIACTRLGRLVELYRNHVHRDTSCMV